MNRNDIIPFVKSVKKGSFVHIEFVKANGELRNAIVQFGVKNPTNALKPGTGIRDGVSFATAAAGGCIKFFEANKVNPNGTRGAYRSARVERILSITANGTKYNIDDNEYMRNNIVNN